MSTHDFVINYDKFGISEFGYILTVSVGYPQCL